MPALNITMPRFNAGLTLNLLAPIWARTCGYLNFTADRFSTLIEFRAFGDPANVPVAGTQTDAKTPEEKKAWCEGEGKK
jgi:hypothetical protein